MISASPKTAGQVVRNIEKSISLAKKLRCLNMFITDTFDDALVKAGKLDVDGVPADNGECFVELGSSV